MKFVTTCRVVILLFSVAATSQTPASRAHTGDWATVSAAESGLSDSRLRALDAAIRAGEFNKIGSVLVARHGKLVHEGYFDGDAETLRDTRSATKSITGALIGIAIEEQKLSGVDATILTLIQNARRRFRIPMRERRQSRSKIS